MIAQAGRFITSPALVSKETSERNLPSREASADNLLLKFIHTTDEEEAERCLSSLIAEHAVPIIREILSSSLHFRVDSNGIGPSTQDASDLFNDIIANLLSRLRHIKDDPAQPAIVDFRSYIAGTAYNACNLYLRRKFPRRSRLKNRLRYLLSHDSTFALWTSESSGLLCGFSWWRDKQTPAHQRLLEKIRQDPVEWTEAVGLLSVGISRAQLSSLLRSLFQTCEGPIRLDDLVNIVADICREKDQPDQQLETVMNLTAPALSCDTVLEQQHTLAILWQEVCQLPRRQRVALLLNFKDARGHELVSLLPYTRSATIEQIAEAIDLPLVEFLKLWNELPLDDMRIAQLLGATRQQVINLRKCARERLERRMSAVLEKCSAGK